MIHVIASWLALFPNLTCLNLFKHIDLGQHLHTPPVNANKKDPMVEAVPVFSTNDVNTRKRVDRRQNYYPCHIRVHNEIVGVEPDQPLRMLVLWLSHLGNQK